MYDLSIADISNTLRVRGIVGVLRSSTAHSSQVFYTHTQFYISVGTFTRISVLFLFLRLTPHTVSPKFRRVVWFLIIFSSVYFVLSIFIVSFPCHPAEAYFDIV